MSNINITVTEQDPINVSIASPEVQNVDVTGQSISATVTDGDKGDIVVTGNGTVWTLDPNALATRVPYTGATSDVNLGEFGLLTGNIEFDTTPTNAPTGAGSMVWNDTEGTVDLVLKGGNLVLPIGQKQTIRAVNGTGGNLTRVQYRAVKITGAQGQRLQVSLARADNDANSKDTIGIVGEDISNNQTGFIVSSGLIEEIDTTGSLQGETWTDGDTLYLSGTTYGVITNVKPSAPTHTVILGFVVYAHANHGKIYVKVDNGYELDELHNVNVSTAASGDYLRYNGTTWVDATISAADLPTGIDAAKIATGTVSNTEFGYLDGVTYAIQTQLNGKQATLTNPVTGTGASGQVSFFNGTSSVTGDNGLFWDNTNKRLGIKTATPSWDLTVAGNDIALTGGSATVLITSASGQGRIRSSTNLFFDTGGSYTNAGVISSSQNWTIGGTSDAGYKLDIQGTLRNTTSAYFATSSGGVGIGTTSVTSGYKLDVVGAARVTDNLQLTTTAFNTTIACAIGGGGLAMISTTDPTAQDQRLFSLAFGSSSYTSQAARIEIMSAEAWSATNRGSYITIHATSRGTATRAEKIRIDGDSNIGIGQTTFGSSATKTIAVSSGTAPSTSPADAFQLYSADITAGNAAPHFRTEGGAVVKLYQQTTGVGAATFVQGSTNAVYEDSTFDGYTLKQIVKALRNAGFLA